MTTEELAIKLTEVDSRSKSNTHRINELSGEIEAVNRLARAVEVMATKQDTMSDTLTRLDGRVETLEAKPAKRWDGIVDKLIWLAVPGRWGSSRRKLQDRRRKPSPFNFDGGGYFASTKLYYLYIWALDATLGNRRLSDHRLPKRTTDRHPDQ